MSMTGEVKRDLGDAKGLAADEKDAVVKFNEKQQHCISMIAAHKYHYQNESATEEMKDAVEIIRKAAEQKDPFAQCLLGMCFSDGVVVAKDKQQAIEWYRKSAEKGFDLAWASLGELLLETNEKEALEWFKKAAEKGSVYACNVLGIALPPSVQLIENEVYRRFCHIEQAKRLVPSRVWSPDDPIVEGVVYLRRYVENAKKRYAKQPHLLNALNSLQSTLHDRNLTDTDYLAAVLEHEQVLRNEFIRLSQKPAKSQSSLLCCLRSSDSNSNLDFSLLNDIRSFFLETLPALDDLWQSRQRFSDPDDSEIQSGALGSEYSIDMWRWDAAESLAKKTIPEKQPELEGFEAIFDEVFEAGSGPGAGSGSLPNLVRKGEKSKLELEEARFEREKALAAAIATITQQHSEESFTISISQHFSRDDILWLLMFIPRNCRELHLTGTLGDHISRVDIDAIFAAIPTNVDTINLTKIKLQVSFYADPVDTLLKVGKADHIALRQNKEFHSLNGFCAKRTIILNDDQQGKDVLTKFQQKAKCAIDANTKTSFTAMLNLLSPFFPPDIQKLVSSYFDLNTIQLATPLPVLRLPLPSKKIGKTEVTDEKAALPLRPVNSY